jgi:hypothetical protein
MPAGRHWYVIRAVFLVIGAAVYVGTGCTGAIGDPARGGQAPAGGGGHTPATSGGGGTGGASSTRVGGGGSGAGGNGSGGAGGSVGSVGGNGSGGTSSAGGAGGQSGATGTIWLPAASSSWQWQLTGTLDQTVAAQMFDVDLFDTAATTVASLHALGHKVVCYVSAGSYEDWRPDAAQFPALVKGKGLDGWPGEQWLDVRQWDALRPLIEARMDLCRSKGFNGIELDNVDGYQNDTGFPLTASDQLTFNRALAASAHARGLSVGLKNDLDQVADLVGSFDWALNEECFTYHECDQLHPFVAAGKAVFNVEYTLATDQFCPQARTLGFNSMAKHLNLDAYRVPCP